MRLAEKLKVLRDVEGMCRARDRALTKTEVVKLLHEETGGRISLAYLSQLEAGTRAHMTNKTRLLLAGFFRIHPGFLVDDPDEYRRHLGAPVRGHADSLGAWLHVGAARYRHDAPVAETLDRLAAHPERRKALRLLRAVLTMPTLMDRLLHTVERKKG
jgi:hypothetical protein